jgi:hypothetical protein
VSRTSNISVSAYLRTAAAVHGQDDMGNDLLMARVDLTPMLDGHVGTVVFLSFLASLAHRESQHASDQWYNAVAGSGSFHLKIDFKQTRNEPLTIEAFDLLKVIGKGSFGKVMQVRKKDTQRIYALKTIRKAHIAQRPGEITHILAERTVLALVNNPFIVPLKFSFQNPDKLYLVMSFGMLLSSSVEWESSELSFPQLMGASFSITCSERANSIKTGVGFMRPNSCALWSICMVLMLFIGESINMRLVTNSQSIVAT